MPAAAARAHPPLGEHLLAVPRAGGELAQLHGDGVGEHQVRPADGRLDAAGEAFEPGGVLRPGARLEQAAVDGPLVEGRGEPRPPDGAADLPGPRCRCTGTGVGVAEGGGPQPLAVGGQPGRLGRQRDLRLHAGSQLTSPASSTGTARAPTRVPVAARASTSVLREGREPAQGVRRALGQRLDRLGDDPAPAQQRLAARDADQLLRGRAGREPLQVEAQDAEARGLQRGRGGRRAGAAAVVTQVDQADLIRRVGPRRPQSVSTRPRSSASVRGRGDVGEQVGQRRVRVVAAEQVRGDPVGHPQRRATGTAAPGPRR